MRLERSWCLLWSDLDLAVTFSSYVIMWKWRFVPGQSYFRCKSMFRSPSVTFFFCKLQFRPYINMFNYLILCSWAMLIVLFQMLLFFPVTWYCLNNLGLIQWCHLAVHFPALSPFHTEVLFGLSVNFVSLFIRSVFFYFWTKKKNHQLQPSKHFFDFDCGWGTTR